MSDDKKDLNNRPSIFKQVLEASSAILEAQIHKSKASMQMNVPEDPGDFVFAKTITSDPHYAAHANGWMDKQNRLLNSQLKQMAHADVVVASIIKTFQNKAASHAKLVKSEQEKGFMLKLRDEDLLLAKIKEELHAEKMKEQDSKIEKSENAEMTSDQARAKTNLDEQDAQDLAENTLDDDTVEEYNWELERKARAKLEDMFKDDEKAVQDWILYCGKTEDKPPQYRNWNFENSLKAWVWDSLVYDLYARELVPDQVGRPKYWFPTDGGTIKYTSNQFRNYRGISENFNNLNILYPEKQVKLVEEQNKLNLDQELLEADAYQYVQVIRGKIERAYTADEMAIGIRNKTTNIYNNGYGTSELELGMNLVSGHLNAEFYNQAYFIQGFSAKGILHIKENINRRKLETVKQQWQHMVKGGANSFQTPIYAGAQDIEWIPLTQNHTDIGFEGWMRYLIRMLCALYQIDPGEIGINLRDEGKGGSLNSGDSTEARFDESKERGLQPLMAHLENFINENIIAPFDERFCIKFTGLTSETRSQTLERQKKESEFKKTVNELRAEDGLPPLPGMDDYILNPVYQQWYDKYSRRATDFRKEAQAQFGSPAEASNNPESQPVDEATSGSVIPQGPDFGTSEEDNVNKATKLAKSRPLKIEYYQFGGDDNGKA